MNFDIEKILSTIENDIMPKTRAGVLKGNKIFGGAILNKHDYSLIIADTNHELDNPIWHGEMYVLKKFYEQKNPPPTKDLIFLSTHEPCSMCLSAITWAGFDNFIYLFSYEESRDLFAIPHDLNILNQVFKIKDGNYKIGIRPHNITTYKEGSNTVEINGKVQISELSGSESLIHFTNGNLNWVSLSNGTQQKNVGEDTKLYMNTDEFLYFDQNNRLVNNG